MSLLIAFSTSNIHLQFDYKEEHLISSFVNNIHFNERLCDVSIAEKVRFNALYICSGISLNTLKHISHHKNHTHPHEFVITIPIVS